MQRLPFFSAVVLSPDARNPDLVFGSAKYGARLYQSLPCEAAMHSATSCFSKSASSSGTRIPA